MPLSNSKGVYIFKMKNLENPLSEKDLIELGFELLTNKRLFFSFYNFSLQSHRGKKLNLCISCLGSANEYVSIFWEKNEQIEDIVCIHNFDRHGFITKERLQKIIESLKF